MVSGNTVHISSLSAAPDIARAYNYTHFNAAFVKFCNLRSNVLNGFKVKTLAVITKCLAA